MAKVILFHEQGAKILEGVDPTPFRNLDNAVIDPDSIPKGIPPHHWKQGPYKTILEMTAPEKKVMDARQELDSPPINPNKDLTEVIAVSRAVAKKISLQMAGMTLGIVLVIEIAFTLFYLTHFH
jgi:hypothetical protein